MGNKMMVKVCGMTNAANIKSIANATPEYMGFIFFRDSPRNALQLDPAATDTLGSATQKVGVFVDSDLQEIKQIVNQYRLDAVQLHGSETPEFCALVRHELPEIAIFKAFGIHPAFVFKKLEYYENFVDMFVFDARSAAHGGSGVRFNWGLLTQYSLSVPFLLSGGIAADHATEIKGLDFPALAGVDINSRFEVGPGIKNEIEVQEFIHKVRS